jgi:FkbM family methyltransferase
VLGGRDWELIKRNVLAAPNWAALARMPRVYEHPVRFARRYFTAAGDYPCTVELKTPLGIETPTLFSHHDLLTVNEVFCREDYRTAGTAEVVVDVGSNIGLSALWFLTRSPSAHVHCFEPVPENAERLERTLANHPARYDLDAAAVADTAGEVAFGTEPTGRYGGIGLEHPGGTITVPCRAITDVLDGVLARHGRIDLVKIDTEGAEARTLAAVRPDQLERIEAVAVETVEDLPVPPGFAYGRRCDVLALTRRG